MSRLQSFVDRVLRAEVIKGTADQYMKCWWLLALPGERRVYLHKFVGEVFGYFRLDDMSGIFAARKD